MGRKTDRHVDRQTIREPSLAGKTDKRIDRWVDRHTGKPTDQPDRQLNGPDGRCDTDRWVRG